jgi:cysteinyl-tRNA synthetase
VKLLNTLSSQLEEFVPAGDEVKIYVCGVTPYDESHVGHGMSYIVFDVLRRYLEYRGLKVRHVQNFTDVDDRIIARAARLGIEPSELVEQLIERYFEDMHALNILDAHEYPRATQEIPEMIRIIEGLVQKGYAYASDGDVYYRVSKKADYGKLSHRSLDSMLEGARVEPAEGKESPADFALWKAEKPGEPSWESPWGPGRPGWHIECSAMSLKYLGEQIDIHGGGEDLIFPHHENEIAQSEAFTGNAPSVRYWLHNAWVKMGEEKMSKSLGNFITIREGLEQFGADAIRVWVLTSHYRTPLMYMEKALESGKRGAERLRIAARTPGSNGGPPVDPSPYRERFLEAMDEDLNTPKALGVLFELAREVNRARDEQRAIEDAQSVLVELSGILGLTLSEPEVGLAAAPFIELLVATRDELRKAKQFELADHIRSGLGELGVALEDTPQGTVWRRSTLTSAG